MKISFGCSEKHHSNIKECRGLTLSEKEATQNPRFALHKRLRINMFNDENSKLSVMAYFSKCGDDSPFKIYHDANVILKTKICSEFTVFPNKFFSFDIKVERKKKVYKRNIESSEFFITARVEGEESKVVLSRTIQEVEHKWISYNKDVKSIKTKSYIILNSYYINPHKEAPKLNILVGELPLNLQPINLISPKPKVKKASPPQRKLLTPKNLVVPVKKLAITHTNNSNELEGYNHNVTFSIHEDQTFAASKPIANKSAICDFERSVKLMEVDSDSSVLFDPSRNKDELLEFSDKLDQFKEASNISQAPIVQPIDDNFLASKNVNEQIAPRILFKTGCDKIPIIASKYFLTKKLPEKPYIEGISENSTIGNEKKVELVPLNLVSKSTSEVYYHKITSNLLNADYYSVDKDFDSVIKNYSRFVFVRAGRKENALVPLEVDSGKVILICSPQEKERLKPFVGKNRDLLVIKNISYYDSLAEIGNYQGLPTTRMLGALAFAWDFGIDNMMLLDDNVKGFYAKNELLQEESSWKDIYGMYQSSAAQGDLACLSIQTHKPTDKNQLTPEVIIREGACGYKSFFIDIKKIKSVANDPICLLPLDPKLFGEDIFFQYVLKEMGLKIASISKKTMVIQRSRGLINTCVNIVSRPEEWFNFQANGVSEAYLKAIESMKEMYENSRQHYECKSDELKNLHLPNYSSLLDKRPLEEFGISSNDDSREVINPRKKRKTQLKSLESTRISNLNLLEEEFLDDFSNHVQENAASPNLRIPQKEALSSFSKVIKNKRFKTGYFKMATGIGKTIVYSSIIDAIKKCSSYQKHNLIITPGIQAANQVYGVLARLEESEEIKTVACINSTYIGQKLVELNENVNTGFGQTYVMTEESAKILFGNNPELLNRFGLVIIDEFHDVSKDLLKFTTLYAKDGGAFVLGFSGTTTKSSLKFFEKRIFDYNSLQAYKDGFLTPWIVDKIQSQAFNRFEQNEEVRNKLFNQLPNLLKEHVHPHGGTLSENQGIIRVEKNGGEKALEVVKKVAKKLNDSGISAAPYHSHLPEAERSKILLDFKNKKIKVIVAHKMLEKAYDGFVDYTIILNKKIHKNSFIQCLGRVIRLDSLKPKKIGYMIVPEDINLREEVYLPSDDLFKNSLNPFYNGSKKVYKIDDETTFSITSQVSNRPAEFINQKNVCRLPLKKGTSKQRAALIADFISNPLNFDTIKKNLGKYFDFMMRGDQGSIKKLFHQIRVDGDINLERLIAKIPNKVSKMRIYTYNIEKQQYELSIAETDKNETSGILFRRDNGEYEVLVPIGLAKFFAQINRSEVL